jgi:DNA polymerase III sliding clamp (beta) subunit (PCNA family)
MITISKKDLVDVVNKVRGIVDKRASIQTLRCILLRTGQDSFNVHATDAHIFGLARIDMATERMTECAVDADLFYRFISKLPKDGEINLDYDDKSSLKVTCGRITNTFAALDADLFPLPRLDEVRSEFELEPDELKRLLLVPSECSSNDPIIQPHFCGVMIQSIDGVLYGTGCDGPRLIRTSLFLGDNLKIPPTIIASKILDNLSRIKTDEPWTIRLFDRAIEFYTGNLILNGRLVDATYPDASSLFSQKKNTHLLFDRARLMEAVDRAITAASDTNAISIDMALGDGESAAICARSSFEVDFREEIPWQFFSEVDVPASGIRFCLNGKYLLAMLKNCQSDNVRISYAYGANGPVFIIDPDHSDIQIMIGRMRG